MNELFSTSDLISKIRQFQEKNTILKKKSHHFVFDCPLNAAARLEFTDAVDEITRQSDPFGWRSRSWSARLKFLLNDGPGDVSPEALRVWTRIQLHFYWYLAVAYKARTAHLRT